MDAADLKPEIRSAIEAADHALQCLIQAQSTMNQSSGLSVIDMLSKGFFPSLLKYSSLSEADRELQIAQGALENLNYQLQLLSKSKSVQLKIGSII